MTVSKRVGLTVALVALAVLGIFITGPLAGGEASVVTGWESVLSVVIFHRAVLRRAGQRVAGEVGPAGTGESISFATIDDEISDALCIPRKRSGQGLLA